MHTHHYQHTKPLQISTHHGYIVNRTFFSEWHELCTLIKVVIDFQRYNIHQRYTCQLMSRTHQNQHRKEPTSDSKNEHIVN